MRVVMVSKALVTGAYQRKAEEIASRGVELTVLSPPSWRDRRGLQTAVAEHVNGYRFKVIPIRFNGNFHLHYYPTLAQEIDQIQPHLLHMDEEPYNLATWLGLRSAQRAGIPATFFTWQNLKRRYPPPFHWFEQANYHQTSIALAGNQAAAEVLRSKGYTGRVEVVPQFGVDPERFHPSATRRFADGEALRIGYAGGLLPEKGIDLLLTACAGLVGPWSLHIVGEGDEEATLRKQARKLGIQERVTWGGRLSSTRMPAFYRGLDVLVLPSRATASWKEQFGRVLIEAMACEVTVVGSDSGEIPHVIGKDGLTFVENDAADLQRKLTLLMQNPTLRSELGVAGRRRVLAHFTMAIVAERTVAVYSRLLSLAAPIPVAA